MMNNDVENMELKKGLMEYKNLLKLDLFSNILLIIPSQQHMKLSETQKRFFSCLMQGVNSKRDIIRYVWSSNHEKVCDNNYHQLIFQTRALLVRFGIPAELICTIHYYGVMINDSVLISLKKTSATTVLPKDTPSPQETWLGRWFKKR